MANTAAQMFAYFLSFVGLLGLIASTFMTDWKNYVRDNGDAIHRGEYVGLWMKCVTGIAGQISCTYFSSILFQKPEINISRGFMITSITLCGIASLVALLGLKCTKCLDANKQLKTTAVTVAGVLFILGGLCAVGLISWYAYKVAQAFHSESADAIKFGFGNALFVGWGAGVFCITGGAGLCIRGKTPNRHRPHTGQTSITKESGREYV